MKSVNCILYASEAVWRVNFGDLKSPNRSHELVCHGNVVDVFSMLDIRRI